MTVLRVKDCQQMSCRGFHLSAHIFVCLCVCSVMWHGAYGKEDPRTAATSLFYYVAPAVDTCRPTGAEVGQ